MFSWWVIIFVVAKNLDILGELCADESKRRLLPSKAWEILLQYFPKAVLYKAEAPVCLICLVGVDLTWYHIHTLPCCEGFIE